MVIYSSVSILTKQEHLKILSVGSANNFDDNSFVIFKGAEAAYVAFYKKWRILHIVGLSSLTNVQYIETSLIVLQNYNIICLFLCLV